MGIGFAEGTLFVSKKLSVGHLTRESDLLVCVALGVDMVSKQHIQGSQ